MVADLGLWNADSLAAGLRSQGSPNSVRTCSTGVGRGIGSAKVGSGSARVDGFADEVHASICHADDTATGVAAARRANCGGPVVTAGRAGRRVGWEAGGEGKEEGGAVSPAVSAGGVAGETDTGVEGVGCTIEGGLAVDGSSTHGVRGDASEGVRARRADALRDGDRVTRAVEHFGHSDPIEEREDASRLSPLALGIVAALRSIAGAVDVIVVAARRPTRGAAGCRVAGADEGGEDDVELFLVLPRLVVVIYQIVDGLLFDEGTECQVRAQSAIVRVADVSEGRIIPSGTALSCGKGLVDVVVVVAGEHELLDVVRALRASCRFSGGLNGRQQQGDQDADDGDHDQQLHEGEAGSASWYKRTRNHLLSPVNEDRTKKIKRPERQANREPSQEPP